MITGFITRAALGGTGALPLLVAPMGASAVLLFAVPASPLAQPWSVLGGNMLSALVGVTCAHWIGDPLLAAALAVCTAIGLMFALRCLHPPGGAVALLSVIGAPAIKAQGYAFAWWPVGFNSLLLVLAAVLYHRLTGHRYPHPASVPPAAQPHGTRDPAPSERLGIRGQDVQAALRQGPDLLDIAEDDLQALIEQAEQRALQRHAGVPNCAHLMSRDVVSVAAEAPLAEAWRRLQRHRVQALPVVDAERRVVGIISQSDFFSHAGWQEQEGLAANWRRFMRRLGDTGGRVPAVAELMSSPAVTVSPGDPLTTLVEAMSDGGLHQLPVVDEEGRLQGIVAQSDLIAALHRLVVAQALQGGRA
ncbi:HPP family protein [Eleftheria terrae]|uniref:HPP family protein n=1 Tax=Eleftheria terrae TaxID=1597781 RepID=UPI00263AD3F3|nr:HPP family protein [Eleftheria terrae]WKB52638.1 HPP family protein [Eleftheria terrae]